MSPTQTPPSLESKAAGSAQHPRRGPGVVIVVVVAAVGALVVALAIVAATRPTGVAPPSSTSVERPEPRPADQGQGEPTTVPLADMTLGELRELATGLGISGAGSMTRAELIEAVHSRQPLMTRCFGTRNCAI